MHGRRPRHWDDTLNADHNHGKIISGNVINDNDNIYFLIYVILGSSGGMCKGGIDGSHLIKRVILIR